MLIKKIKDRSLIKIRNLYDILEYASNCCCGECKCFHFIYFLKKVFYNTNIKFQIDVADFKQFPLTSIKVILLTFISTYEVKYDLKYGRKRRTVSGVAFFLFYSIYHDYFIGLREIEVCVL